jgi:glycerol-3-phosphate acyltransferase PlsY
MQIVLLAILSYLYGSIPFGFIATYVTKGEKLTEKGTGNAGVTNAYKVGGTGVGIVTIMGEISKALVPVYTAKALFPDSLFVTFLLVFSSLVGTSFSVLLKGRGGKGSTAAIWSILLLSPYSCLLLLVTWLILALLARITLSIKKLQLLCIPCVIYLVEHDTVFTFFALLTSLLFFFNNYRRKDDFAYYNILKQKSGLKDADSIHP